MSATVYDVAVVGGGIVGSALACALGASGLRVALLERESASMRPLAATHDVRVSALTLASRNLFANLAVWPHMVAARIYPIARMRVWESNGDTASQDSAEMIFDAADIGAAYLGFIAENNVIANALRARLATLPSVSRYEGHAIDAIVFNDHTVEVQSGDALVSAQLVIGADGADSLVRHAAGIEAPQRPYNQRAIVATITTTLANTHTAWQRFLPTGPLALLPLDAHHYSIVWSLTATRADELMALTDTEFLAALGAAFGEGRVRAELGALTHVGPRAAFPLAAAHAQRYVGARVAIVGDAAHRIHPLAGQGLNLGLSDAAALAQVVIEAQRARRDWGALRVLRRYERWRKGDNLAMLTFTDLLYRLFTQQSPPLRFMRRSGLRAIERATPVKNILIRYAAGLQGELPELCRLDAATGQTQAQR